MAQKTTLSPAAIPGRLYTFVAKTAEILTTPASRTYIVAAEDRVFVVGAEDRTYTVS